MALVNRSFSVNVTPGMMPPIVHVSEYDVGRAYTVSILDEQGNTFTIPSGTTASIEGTLNGSVGFTTSATISNNQITFALTESMTAYAGRAWCKIKLTLSDEPIQTCAFVLAVDRAGVEADTVIGASGFKQQIVDAVQDWLDEHPPASGGMTEEFKQALLDCFENVAWINDDGQTFYDALYAALYPPKTLVSISAAFNQGSAVIYDTDDLDTLKQYLAVTAYYDDSSTGVVTNYTLSGTLTEGTSTITVSYGGKSTTFDVVVSAELWDFKWDYTMGKLEEQDGWTLDSGSSGSSTLTGDAERITCQTGSKYRQIFISQNGSLAAIRTMTNGLGVLEVKFTAHVNSSEASSTGCRITAAQSSTARIAIITANNKFRVYDNNNNPNASTAFADFLNDTEYTLRIVYKGTTADVYINEVLASADISTSTTIAGASNNVMVNNLGDGYYVDLKSLKLKVGSIS